MERALRLLELVPELLRSGLIDSSGGNLSVRTEHGVLITPSLAGEQMRWQLSVDDMVLFPGDGDASMARAGRRASRENRLHRAVLTARPDWNCVYHGHPWGLLGFCLAGVALPVPRGITEHFGKHDSREIPITGSLAPGSVELAEKVTQVVRESFAGNSHGVVLLQGHGPVVGGKDVDSTLSLAQVLENLARAQQWRLAANPAD